MLEGTREIVTLGRSSVSKEGAMIEATKYGRNGDDSMGGLLVCFSGGV